MEDEILNSKEAAKYLKISKPYLIKMAKEEQIPFLRIGRAYRFTRTSLNQWINKRLNVNEEAWLCHNK